MGEIKKIGILTSGGDAPGMNTCIRAIVKTCATKGIQTFGIYDGYKGIIDNDIKELHSKDVSNILNLGGTILGTVRFPEFKDEKVREIAAKKIKEIGIDALVCLGGDGTYMGAYYLSKLGVPCVGVPCTIDNDIASSEYTIGFDTALNTAVENIDKIRDTSRSHYRCMIIEVMGRYCPDIAIRSGICCGAEYVLTSKDMYTKESFLEAVRVSHERDKKNCIVIVAEHTIPVDELKSYVDEQGLYECRTAVLGQVQRGGRPTAFDRILASRLGNYAVELLCEGKTGICVGVKGENLTYMDINEASLLPNKVPTKLIKQFKDMI